MTPGVSGRPGSSTGMPAPGFAARHADRLLRGAATSWFVVAVLGQLIFALYVLGFYGRAAWRGDWARWNQVLPHGHVAGDPYGNLVLSMHLLFAVLIMLSGALQLIPAIRRRWPGMHRWNGRVYLVLAVTMSLGGLVMVATRRTVGDLPQHVAIVINALLILVCAAMAWRHARARRFDAHRRWALSLFLVVSGVWFFRIGLMLWIVANRGPAGFDPDRFTGPFLSVLAFAQYLVPLAMLQLYLYVRANAAQAGRIAMAACLGVLTLMTAAGIAAATMIMWLPRL